MLATTQQDSQIHLVSPLATNIQLAKQSAYSLYRTSCRNLSVSVPNSPVPFIRIMTEPIHIQNHERQVLQNLLFTSRTFRWEEGLQATITLTAHTTPATIMTHFHPTIRIQTTRKGLLVCLVTSVHQEAK